MRRKRVDVRGSDRQHLVVLLKTRNDNRVPVDLGSPGQLGNRMPSVGDRVRVRGRLIRIGDRGIIVGDELQTQGERVVRIDQRPPRMARQGDQQTRGRGDQRGDRRGRDNRGRQGSQGSQGSQAGLGVALSGDQSGAGVAVMQVLRGSPAARAGLQSGDRILALDGSRVRSPQELMRLMERKQPGDSVRLLIRRNDQRRQLTAELVTRQQALDRARQQQQQRQQQGGR